jgi:serine/threonine-protein kinase
MGDFLLEPLLRRLLATLPFQPGELVNGRFRIRREVGQGAMGVVFEAMDEKLGEKRAIKCAKPGFGARLPLEARNALRVAHPNVCRLFEVHTAETPVGPVDFLSMEYVEESTLVSCLAENAPVGLGRALRLGCQLAGGLAQAHRRNILHRDLKPGNVMIAANGERAVITDFGLAQEPAPAASGDLRGAPDYIPPERWLGRPAVAASDVYSLGVILYELLTGRPPFPRGVPIETRLHGKPPPPSQVWRGVPHALDALVLRCLDPDPAKRFPSGAAVADLLAGKSSRRWMLRAAAPAACIVLVAVLWTIARDPPDVPRLAILPATSTDAQAITRANALLDDLSTRLMGLRFREGRA